MSVGWDVAALDRQQCMHVLREAPVGRVVAMEGTLPVVCTIPFSLMEDAVVVRVRCSSKLFAVAVENVVAFHVDTYDTATHESRSVLIHGLAEEVIDLPGDRPPLGSDIGSGRDVDRLIRVRMTAMCGERVVFPHQEERPG